MGWIKRNLFFVIGCVLAVVLLGAGGFFIYKGVERNTQALEKLNEIYGNLKTLSEQKPAPGNSKINNTAIAKDQEKELRQWMHATAPYFHPISALPTNAVVTSQDYSSALAQTINQLQRVAETTGIALPPKYGFSFSAQQQRVKFAAGSLEPLAVQLGEVKAICEILFASRINALDGIQRERVSEDDKAGSQADYLDARSVTNELSIMTPYAVTFRCFTPELSRVLTGFAKSPHAFLVKSVNVQPAGTAVAMAAVDPMQGRMMMGPDGIPFPPMASSPQPAAPKSGAQAALKEQLLRVVVELELVKLLPKS